VKRTSIRAALAYTVFAVSAAALLLPNSASAVVTANWGVDSYKDFDEGEADNSFITSLGEVKAGWNTKRTDLEFDGVWSAVTDKDGSVLVGTDDEATIYRITGNKVTKVADIADTIAVVSLALASDGSLYAGTMPGGEVWKVDTGAGTAAKLATLTDAETVWSLAIGAKNDKLYAGTGPNGALFEIDPANGKSRSVFETDDKRILALVGTSDGAIWMGTSDKALVFRHDPAKKTTRAMADFAGNEITAMAASGAGVIVTANDLKEPITSGTKTKAQVDKAKKKAPEGEKPKMPDKGSTPGADKDTASGSEVTRKGGRKGKGALYRVHGDGNMEQLHALTATYFTALAVTADGVVFAGAADKGRIYMIDTDQSVSTAFDVEERQIAALVHDETHGVRFATGDAAAFYATDGKSSKASYSSKVFDTKTPSRFGKIAWHGAGKLKVETRSGNTSEPGKGWSNWTPPKKATRGGGNSFSAKVASPTGRYIQWRVSFNGDPDSVLRKATVYYLPHNRATKLTEVTIEPSSNTKSLVTLKSGAKPRSPVVKVKWKIDNPDKDETVYSLSVRQEGAVLWREIQTGDKPLTGTSYDWNTETFPDGYYRLRVTASDSRANSSDRAMESTHTTGLFLVDNEKPAIDGINVKYPLASAKAADTMSTIAEMSYSVDDGPWQVGASRDAIFDDLTEMLKIALPDDLDAGVHTLAIRVADEAGNIGSASVTFRVK
jgi:hypothetical protein